MPDPQPRWIRGTTTDGKTRWERTNTLGHQEAITLHPGREPFVFGLCYDRGIGVGFSVSCTRSARGAIQAMQMWREEQLTICQTTH